MSSLLSPRATVAALALLLAAGCAHGGAVVPPQQAAVAPAPLSQTEAKKGTSILKTLKKQVVIGSTISPKLHQLNPYGLTVAPSTYGDFKAGDLVVCNFNNNKNVQGTGYTIVTLHPTPGSTPHLFSTDKLLRGCDALALTAGDVPFTADFSANNMLFLTDVGKLVEELKGKPFNRPFGVVYAQPASWDASLYESNAGDGTIVRVNIGFSQITYDVIATGFAINHGKPGSILGPSGLAYNPVGDILYIVDGKNNTVVSFSNVSVIPKDAIKVGKDGKTFTGPSAHSAHLVFAGTPLNAPISSALLYNGNLVVGNTGNPAGQNIMVELSPDGKVLATRNVDKGAAGAIFGMVATGTSTSTTKLYFNDDNANNLQVLQP